MCGPTTCWAAVECFMTISISSDNLLANVDFQVNDLLERGMASAAASSTPIASGPR